MSEIAAPLQRQGATQQETRRDHWHDDEDHLSSRVEQLVALKRLHQLELGQVEPRRGPTTLYLGLTKGLKRFSQLFRRCAAGPISVLVVERILKLPERTQKGHGEQREGEHDGQQGHSEEPGLAAHGLVAEEAATHQGDGPEEPGNSTKTALKAWIFQWQSPLLGD